MRQSHQPAWKGILVLLSSVVAASLIAVQPFARSVAAQAEAPTGTPTGTSTDSSTVTPDATWTATSIPADVLMLSTAEVTPTDTPLPEPPTSTATAVLNDTLALDPANAATATALPEDLVLRPDSANATATRTPTPINVGNFVWDDLDQDGRQDVGEPGLAGVTVQLWNSTKTLVVDQTNTNASGNYTLIAPTPGNYRVRVVLPSFNDQFSPKDLAGGDDTDDSDINASGTDFGFTDIYVFGSNLISISSIDAGIIKFRTPTPTRTPTPINLGNFVWDDLDQDGRQDAGEPGLAGVTVQLWNSTKTAIIDQTITNANGNYTVVAPLPGSYRIRVILPSINDQFSPKDLAGGDDTDDSDINPTGSNLGFTDIIAIASNVISISNLDAGIIKFRTPTPTRTPTPINLGNFVWNDLNANGLQDPGEPGVAGVTVQLWNSAKSQILDTAVTNANGNYTVVAPLPGNYRLRVILPWAGAEFAPKDVGADNTDDSDFNTGGADWGFTDIISIASNVISISNLDAGLIDPIAPTPTATVAPFNIGNYVWHDLNGDGGQDRGEPGLYKIRVQLWNSTKTLMIDSTLTNTSGQYYLNAPGPGSYRVRVLLPNNQPSAGFTVVNANCNDEPFGIDDLCDSDIYPTGGDFGYSRVYTFTGSSNVTLIDAGMINVIAIPTPTNTPTPPPTDTATSTPEPTGTPPLPGTPVPQYDTYLPVVIKP